MTGSVRVESTADSEEGPAAGGRRVGDIGDLLAAIAVSCRESVARFEDAVGRITDIIVRQSGGNDRNLVMALQNFDRLQQEFATLGEVVARISAAHPDGSAEGSSVDSFCRNVIASVTIAELQERLSYHFRSRVEDPDQLDDSEDVEF